MQDRALDDIRGHAVALRAAADQLDAVAGWIDGAADVAVAWVRRAAAVAWWRATRDGVPAPPAVALRELAERCRKTTATSLFPNLFRSRAGAAPTADEIAGELDALADQPQSPLSVVRQQLGERLDAVTDGVVQRLLDLNDPDGLIDLARDPALAQRLRNEAPAGWRGRAAAAVAVARLLLRTNRSGVGGWLPRWCADFRLRFGTGTNPPPGAATAPTGWWFAPPSAAPPPTDDEWANLPPPPTTSKYDCPMFHDARRAGGRRAALKDEFARWVHTDGGAEYLDWFLQLASGERTGSDAARRWWRAIRDDGWVTVFPDYDPDADELLWPSGVPLAREVASETGPATEPAGTILEARRFSADPSRARLKLSDGPEPPKQLGLFSAAVAATAAAGWADAWADGRWGEGRALALGGPGDAAGVTAGVLRVLADNPPGAERVASADAALTAIRAWAAGHALRIVPEPWTFGRGCERGDLPDTAATALWFRTTEPPGRVYKVRRFGLLAADGERQAASVSASAGPPPAGFLELKGFVGSEPARPLAELLARWATARVGGYLPDAAIELFAAFYGPPGDPLRSADPAADAFAEQLAVALAGLRLTVFRPASLFDHPDGWVSPVGDSPARTGRVRVLHRPGVHDDAHNLRLPALAEIE